MIKISKLASKQNSIFIKFWKPANFFVFVLQCIVYKKKTISQLKKKISAPVLLLLYINDMINMTNFLSSFFADDTGLFLSNSSFFSGVYKIRSPTPWGERNQKPKRREGKEKRRHLFFRRKKYEDWRKNYILRIWYNEK